MGCEPIAFIGQDLAFTDNKYHSKMACVEDEKNIIIDNMDCIRIKDINNNYILTDASLYHFLCWIEDFISKNEKKHFINATEGGANIKGASNISLSYFISKYCTERFIQTETINKFIKSDRANKYEIEEDIINIKRVISNFKDMKTYVEKNLSSAKLLKNIYDENEKIREDIIREMDYLEEKIDLYQKEESMMVYYMQTRMIEIVCDFKEKIDDYDKGNNLRIINKDIKIYKMKYEAIKKCIDKLEDLVIIISKK